MESENMSIENNKGLHASVFRCALGDCTNNGKSKYAKNICIVNLSEILGYDCDIFDADEDAPAFKLVAGNLRGTVKLVPVGDEREGKGAGPMFGGNYAATSDGRFGKACRKIVGGEFYGAVAIHDRFETWKDYDALSR